MKPKATVKQGKPFGFKLKPRTSGGDPVDYMDMTVTIKGKTGSASWINLRGKARDGNTIALCVPPNQAVGTYEYFVEVEKLGKLDPRADVER